MNDTADQKLPKVARVHEDTVSKAQKHAEEAGRKMAKRAPSRRRAVTTRDIKVDPRVWQEALRLAGGDASRLRVISAEEVIVENRSKHK